MSNKLIRTAGQAISSEVDFDAPGKQVGHLRLPYSVHRSAYGWLPIPVASIKNGEGPVIVVAAGNHGDEYEGQIIVSRLIREIQPEMLQGQLILLPMANFPAAQAGTRTSPLDGGNLNRLFPGNPSGTPTEMIASYLETVIFARSELLLDLHSGGSSLLYDGMNVIAAKPREGAEEERVMRLLNAFGAQQTYFRQVPSAVTTIGAARRQGSISFVAELGGAGMVTPAILAGAWDGVRHVLHQAGVLAQPLIKPAPERKTRFMHIDFDGPDFYLYADCAGLFEPLVNLGDSVRAGQPAARLHFPDQPGREPRELHFAIDAVVVCKRVQAQAQHGDCLYQLAQPLAG